MLEIVFIFAIGLAPSLLSVWMMRYAEAQGRERLIQALEAAAAWRLPTSNLAANFAYLDSFDQVIGDRHCRFNAHSAYLRCAVNPSGPCANCRHFEAAISGSEITS